LCHKKFRLSLFILSRFFPDILVYRKFEKMSTRSPTPPRKSIFSYHSSLKRQSRHKSREGPGKTPVLSEKDAARLLNLVPLRFFAERKRADKGFMSTLSALSLNDN